MGLPRIIFRERSKEVGHDFIGAAKSLSPFKLLQHSPMILFEILSIDVLDWTLTFPESPLL